MRTSLNPAIELIRQHEGGYAHHPRDPGGCTNMGITLATFRAHLLRNGNCGDLSRMTWNQAAAIYRRHYWDAVRGDDLPAGLDLSVFDMAVNAGVGRAARLLQGLLGVREDGQIGPVTLAMLAQHGPAALIHDYALARLRYYRALPGWEDFGKGWTDRTNKTRAAAFALAQKKSP